VRGSRDAQPQSRSVSLGLNRRIPEKQILIEEVAAWEPDRNANRTKADWHFTTANARIKVEMIEAMRRSLSLIQLWSAHVARCRR